MNFMRKSLPELIENAVSHVEHLREKMRVLENYPEDADDEILKDCLERSMVIREDIRQIWHRLQTNKERNRELCQDFKTKRDKHTQDFITDLSTHEKNIEKDDENA